MKLNEISLWRSIYDRPRKRGDFDIHIRRDHKVMIIPSELFNLIILECNARSAETVMDYLQGHPQTIARFLGWTEEEVKIAFQKLSEYVQAAINIPRFSTSGTRRR